MLFLRAVSKHAPPGNIGGAGVRNGRIQDGIYHVYLEDIIED
jgi:hypothetical protein